MSDENLQSIPVQKSRTNFSQFYIFYGIENDRNRIPADTNRIKSDSPDAKQTVPDYFAPVSDSKKTIPDICLTGTGLDQRPGTSPGLFIFSSLEEAGVQGRSPA